MSQVITPEGPQALFIQRDDMIQHLAAAGGVNSMKRPVIEALRHPEEASFPRTSAKLKCD